MGRLLIDSRAGAHQVEPAGCEISLRVVGVNPTPYTLHPTPYTLHPTPYTLPPTPSTLNPQPSTRGQLATIQSQEDQGRIDALMTGIDEATWIGLNDLATEVNPTPYILQRPPYTIHPQNTPYTLHHAPYTLHPTPYPLHPTLYTLHPLSIYLSRTHSRLLSRPA